LLSILSQEARVSEQFSLFADENAGPEGLRHADHFVSPALEQSLIREIAVLPLTPFQFGQYEGKRRVASFGFSYDYTLRCLTEAEPIPRWLSDVVPKVEAFGGPGTRIQQVLCTEYDVGVGIGWHRDKPHFDRIFGLSLGSTCKLRFRRQAYTKWVRYTREALPRSIYEMSGPSRTVWEHSIPEVEAKALFDHVPDASCERWNRQSGPARPLPTVHDDFLGRSVRTVLPRWLGCHGCPKLPLRSSRRAVSPIRRYRPRAETSIHRNFSRTDHPTSSLAKQASVSRIDGMTFQQNLTR
jgi:alkylated DNA repair dioxygenase AlkB